MIGPSTQIGQPVPLFYGVLAAGVTTQALEEGYDYVVTAIIATCYSGGGPNFFGLRDESGVQILSVALDSSGSDGPRTWSFAGELPIGPRTALGLYSADGDMVVAVSGYALTPETLLHV